LQWPIRIPHTRRVKSTTTTGLQQPIDIQLHMISRRAYNGGEVMPLISFDHICRSLHRQIAPVLLGPGVASSFTKPD
jgi:hypothetical protein